MNNELKLFAGLQKKLTVSLRFNQNLPVHPEIIHSASSILFRVIPVISQPPFWHGNMLQYLFPDSYLSWKSPGNLFLKKGTNPV